MNDWDELKEWADNDAECPNFVAKWVTTTVQRIAELEQLLLDAEAGKTEYLAMQDRIAELEQWVTDAQSAYIQCESYLTKHKQRIAELEAERSNYDVEVHAAYRELEKLRAENQRLREALAEIAGNAFEPDAVITAKEALK